MAMTRLQFYSYVFRDFKRDDKETEIYQAYNDTIKHISGLFPSEGVKYQSYIYTEVGVEDYPLPSNRCQVLHPLRCIESFTSANGYSMNKRSKEEWSILFPNPNASPTTEITTGQPTDYCIYSGSVLVGPLPDKATYIIEMDWCKKPTGQDYASDVRELDEDWDEVIKWGTLARVYESIGLVQEADRYWQLYSHPDFGYPHLIQKEKDHWNKMGKVEYCGF